MLFQELLHEQQFLQHLWYKHRAVGLQEKPSITEQVQYVSRDGWSVLSYDQKRHIRDILFLGRTIEEAQQRISAIHINWDDYAVLKCSHATQKLHQHK
jgi:hypothetical protein